MYFIDQLKISSRRWIREHKTLDFYYIILKNTLMEFAEDGGAHMAAGIAFFIFFSLFPILLIGISIVGYKFSSPSSMADIQQFLTQFLPAQADFLLANVQAISKARQQTGLLGLLGLLWSGRGMFLAMEYSLNKAWGNAPSRSFMGSNLLALSLIFIIGIILILIVAISSILTYLINLKVPIFNFSLSQLSLIVTINQWVISTLLIFLIFMVLYKVLPHSKLSIRDVVPGAVFSTIIWKIAEAVYIWYIANMANLAEVYGSIGSIIGILLWLYIAAAVFLLGAEFNISYLRRKD
jgi:membrane protein